MMICAFGKRFWKRSMRAPVEPRKIAMLLHAAIGDAVMALHHVALAPRIMREVDREAELRREARILRALVELVDVLVVAARIELEDLERVGRALRHLLDRRLGRRRLHHRDAELAGRLRDGRDAAFPEQLQPADRRDQHGDANLAAVQLGRAVDVLHVAQDARLERDAVERLPVPRERRFGLGAADDVVPVVAVELELRRLEKLVQVLKALANVVHPSDSPMRRTGDDCLGCGGQRPSELNSQRR